MDLANVEEFELFQISPFDQGLPQILLFGCHFNFGLGKGLLITSIEVSLNVLAAETCLGDCHVFLEFLDQTIQDVEIHFVEGVLAVDKDSLYVVVEM